MGEEMCVWRERVEAVKRVNPPTKHRVRPNGVYDARGAPRSMSLKEEDAMDDIIQAVVAWNGHDSSCLVVDDVDGVKEFTNTQLGHQLWLCGSEVEGKEQPPSAQEVLLSELPPDPSQPWAVPVTHKDKIKAIKDICQRHRGEVREIKGEWTEVDSPFPTTENFFHPQFWLEHEDQKAASSFGKGGKGVGKTVQKKKAAGELKGNWQAELKNTFIQPAWGGEPASGGSPSKHRRRKARVFGLLELFVQFGAQFSAKVLYEYYLTTKIIVHKRDHGSADLARRAAAWERKHRTGYWGFSRQ